MANEMKQEIINKIMEALNDEYTGSEFYDKLHDMLAEAGNLRAADVVADIADVESEHAEKLKEVLKELQEREAAPTIGGKLNGAGLMYRESQRVPIKYIIVKKGITLTKPYLSAPGKYGKWIITDEPYGYHFEPGTKFVYVSSEEGDGLPKEDYYYEEGKLQSTQWGFDDKSIQELKSLGAIEITFGNPKDIVNWRNTRQADRQHWLEGLVEAEELTLTPEQILDYSYTRWEALPANIKNVIVENYKEAQSMFPNETKYGLFDSSGTLLTGDFPNRDEAEMYRQRHNERGTVRAYTEEQDKGAMPGEAQTVITILQDERNPGKPMSPTTLYMSGLMRHIDASKLGHVEQLIYKDIEKTVYRLLEEYALTSEEALELADRVRGKPIREIRDIVEHWLNEKQKSSNPGKESTAERKYTYEELRQIAKIFYEITSRETATVFRPPGIPIYTPWDELSSSVQNQTIEGLKSRIERETLTGYLERKRPQVGDRLTELIKSELRSRGLLESSNPASIPGERKIMRIPEIPSFWAGVDAIGPILTASSLEEVFKQIDKLRPLYAQGQITSEQWKEIDRMKEKRLAELRGEK